MSNGKINWLKVREPLRGVCRLNTVDGLIEIHMHEPSDDETDDILKIWPTPSRPMKEVKDPIEDEKGTRLVTRIVPETDPEILKEWEERLEEVLEWQAMAFSEAAIDQEYKPDGDTKQERVAMLMKMPKQVRIKLVNFAHGLTEKRLAERFEEAKNS